MLGQSCAAAGVSAAQIARVGVAACGPFVMNQGLVELAAPNLCGGLAGPARGLPNTWTRAALEAPLRAVFADVRVCNDAVAALQAERRWGALQGFEHCAYVTWSTGIGVGLCVDGHVLRGKSANAGHAGHMFVSDNLDALCGCGNLGDVEGLVAGNAIARRYAALGHADAAALFGAAEAGDAAAVAEVEGLCRVMGRMLYNLVITLDLQAISLGGGVFWHHCDFLLPRLAAQIQGRLPALTDGVLLLPAGLQDQVGDYAALALVA
jgi:glucokinase